MAELTELEKRPALSGWPMIIGWLAMLIFALHACTRMVGAGDTWVALASGRHFINHGVNTVEPFSANSHKAGPSEEDIKTWPDWAQWVTKKVGLKTVQYWHPTGWVNQNWLTHVIFYWLTTLSPFADAASLSFNTLVYWKFAIYIITVACVYYTGRILGVNPALSAVFSCFAMFVGRSLLDIRPAGFSNMLVAVFLLALVLTTYRNILYIWLIVPIAVFWCNLHGGYIYVFIMMVPFVVLHFLTSFSKKRFVSIGQRGVIHAIAASIIAFIATIIFNPFHLTNLTHTFAISISKHAEMWRSVNEWHPAFEWSNPVGTGVPFLIMYIIGWAALAAWAAVFIITFRSFNRSVDRKRAKNLDQYQWPKIDLSLIAIAAMTIYMAIESRRFIPIAAIAACPVIAMFIDQMIRSISAMRNFHRENRLTVPTMPKVLRLSFTLAGAAAVVFFGTWWGLKFKYIYLDAWPSDTKLTSVFMRMTASDAKPFYACQFIRDNKLKGKMFNYWTEGGFIAWGQDPDPNTGKTPLQLFMDGRAQAAYEPRVYDLWANIMSGGTMTGQMAANASARGRNLTAAEYTKIGQWMNEQFKRYNVWVVLMPAAELNGHSIKGLEGNPDWRLVFYDNKQKLYADITTPQGRELFEGIFNDKTIYPDEFTKDLIKSHNLLLSAEGQADPRMAFDFAVKAFEISPSQAPLQGLMALSSYGNLGLQVYNVCKNYFEDFTKNKNIYAKKDGYYQRMIAALITCDYLQQIATNQKDQTLAESYNAKMREYNNEINRLMNTKRW